MHGVELFGGQDHQEDEMRKAKQAVDPDYFFAHEPAPSGFEQAQHSVRTWLQAQCAADRRIAVVTVPWRTNSQFFLAAKMVVDNSNCVNGGQSGGTTVPLEKNTVRFIDNFR